MNHLWRPAPDKAPATKHLGRRVKKTHGAAARQAVPGHQALKTSGHYYEDPALLRRVLRHHTLHVQAASLGSAANNHTALRRGALRRTPQGANHTALRRGALRRTVVTVPPCGKDRASAAVLLQCHAALLVHGHRKMQQLRQDRGGQALKPSSSLPCAPGRNGKQAQAVPRCRKTTSR